MDNYAPTYTLHHLVRERYPRFVDALGDIDDALTLVYLFAALPSEKRIKARVTNKAKSLAAAWGAYCATTSSVTKNFISVKGVYFEANVQGSTVRWIVPHAFTQHMPTDVDYRVMLTFFEFYETLLGFVLFKLYSDIGVRYPLPISALERNNASSILAANLHALSREARTSKGMVSNAVDEAIEASKKHEMGEAAEAKKKLSKKDRALIKSVDVALNKIAGGDSDSDDEADQDEDDVDVSAPLKAALESVSKEERAGGGILTDASTHAILDDDATKRRRLFSGLTFFLSREVPRGYLELVCLAFGGRVGWEDDDSPVKVNDASITHHIVDRPRLPSSFDALPKSREFVQPQWIFDCANFHFLLPCSRYGVGAALPPHLSPWVDDEEEGYKPAYAEEVERLKNGEAVDIHATAVVAVGERSGMEGDGDEDSNESGGDGSSRTDDDDGRDEENIDSEEEDEDVKAEKLKKRKLAEEEETKELAKMMMSKKAARLYGRMQHGLDKKQEKIEELQRRRRELEKLDDLQRKRKELEYSKEKVDGETMTKQKVKRLKNERKQVEKDYTSTGGSMKKGSKRSSR